MCLYNYGTKPIRMRMSGFVHNGRSSIYLFFLNIFIYLLFFWSDRDISCALLRFLLSDRLTLLSTFLLLAFIKNAMHFIFNCLACISNEQHHIGFYIISFFILPYRFPLSSGRCPPRRAASPIAPSASKMTFSYSNNLSIANAIRSSLKGKYSHTIFLFLRNQGSLLNGKNLLSNRSQSDCHSR